MKILLVTDNLMTRAWLAGELSGTGAEILDRGDADAPDLVAVDLSAREPSAAIARMRDAHPSVRIVAFGPHVDGAAFARARAAGAHETVARGKTLARLRALLRPEGAGT